MNSIKRLNFLSQPLGCFIPMMVLLGFLIGGCQRNDSIEVHQVPKSESGLHELDPTPGPPGAGPTLVAGESAVMKEPTDRMVVAMFSLDKATWFFKINGTIEAIKQTESQWRPFLKSIKFVDGKPEWKLPESWSEGKTRPMRLATLEIGEAKPPLELAISELSAGQDVLLNVNRWREQMGLTPITKNQLDQETETLDAGGESGVLFDVVGHSSGGMRPPFAGGGSAPFAGGMKNAAEASSRSHKESAPQNTAASAGKKPDFEFKVPDGWKRGKTSSMVPVRLEKTDDGKSAQITITGLSASINTWDSNVVRWAGQVGMTDLTDEELKSRTKEIEVDDIKGKMLTLIPETGEQATVAGMITQGDTAWFLKLTGDKSIVEVSQDAFESFVQSVKLP